MDGLQRYQKVEQQHREKQRERVVRQFKIVKPDATPEETAAVLNEAEAGSTQIFSRAVRPSRHLLTDSRKLISIIVIFVQPLRRKICPTSCAGKKQGSATDRANTIRVGAAI